MFSFSRLTRVSELLQQELSGLLRSIKDPGLSGFITLTGVELSRDMKTARVFYSVLGSEDEKKSTDKALERSAPFLRHQLKARLSLRLIPNLEFIYDETPERAHRIERILDRIQNENPEGS